MPPRLHSDMQNCFSQVLITSRKEELCAILCRYEDSWWESACVSCQSRSASTSYTSIIPSASELFVHFRGLTHSVHSNDILTSNIYVNVNVAQWATISFIFHKFFVSYFGPDIAYNSRSSWCSSGPTDNTTLPPTSAKIFFQNRLQFFQNHLTVTVL